jgi:hypothetical protein
MTDEAFYVTAKIGLADYSFTVFPMWEKEEEDSYFTIRKQDEMIGLLYRTSNDRWEWTEGGLSQDEADELGIRLMPITINDGVWPRQNYRHFYNKFQLTDW